MSVFRSCAFTQLRIPAMPIGRPKPVAIARQSCRARYYPRFLPMNSQYRTAKNLVCVLNGKFVRGPSG